MTTIRNIGLAATAAMLGAYAGEGMGQMQGGRKKPKKVTNIMRGLVVGLW